MSGFFSAFGVDWRLLTIQIINFGVLLTALSYFLYRPVTQMLDERRQKIAEGVRASEAAAQRLSEAQDEGNALVAQAAREAEGLLAASRIRAEERAISIVRMAEERADATTKDAALRAAEAKRQALEESRKEIARAAMLAAEKILRDKTA